MGSDLAPAMVFLSAALAATSALAMCAAIGVEHGMARGIAAGAATLLVFALALFALTMRKPRGTRKG